MKLTITTIERTVFESDKVLSVTLPTLNGQITILPHHSALVASAGTGEIQIISENKPLQFFIDGGVIQIINNNVEILAEVVEKAEELEEAKIQEAIRRAEKIIAENPTEVDLAFTESLLRRENEKFKYLQKWRRLH